MLKGKKSLIADELVPLVVFIIVAAFAFVYIDFTEGIKAGELNFVIGENAKRVDYDGLLQDFVHRYGNDIASSHDSGDYGSLSDIAARHFSSFFIAKGFEWRLDLIDSDGNIVSSLQSSSSIGSKQVVAVAAVPFNDKKILIIRLSEGVEASGGINFAG